MGPETPQLERFRSQKAMVNHNPVAASSEKDIDRYLRPIVPILFVWLNQNMSVAGNLARAGRVRALAAKRMMHEPCARRSRNGGEVTEKVLAFLVMTSRPDV